MEYPHLSQHFSKEELFEYFSLTQDEKYTLPQWRKEQNVLGFAVLLKSFQFLGFPPRKKDDITVAVVSWISEQIDVSPRAFEKYLWKGRLWDMHLASIRNYVKWQKEKDRRTEQLKLWK